MPRGWRGNHRSGIALAMCHRLSGLSTYGLTGLSNGDEHPAYTPEGHGMLYFFIAVFYLLNGNALFVCIYFFVIGTIKKT